MVPVVMTIVGAIVPHAVAYLLLLGFVASWGVLVGAIWRDAAWRPRGRLRSRQRGFYAAYLRSPTWQAQRQRALARGAALSALRRAPTGKLHVHHVTYARLGQEAGDLAVLCPACHAAVHGRRRIGR